MSVQNMGASIRNRLLDKARAEKLDFNLLLTRYAAASSSRHDMAWRAGEGWRKNG